MTSTKMDGGGGSASLIITGSRTIQLGSAGPHLTLGVSHNPAVNPYDGFAEVADADGVASLAVDAITISGALGAHEITYKATSSGGRPDINLTFTITVADTVAPVLTLPTDIKTGQTAATIGATTNKSGGTLFGVVTPSAIAPDRANIIAGKDDGGAPAPSGSVTVSSTGVKTLPITGLIAATHYYGHLVQRDALGNISNVVTGDGFTTDAPSAPGTSIWLWEDGTDMLWEDSSQMDLEEA